MVVLDAQVHTWYSDRPELPWDPGYRPAHVDKPSYLQHAGQTNTPDMVRAELAAAGVDGALLVPNGVYGKSIEFELSAAEADPARFRVMGLVDHTSPELGAHLERSRERGLVAIRMLEMREPERLARGEFDDALRVSADLGLPVALSLSHPIDARLHELFVRHRDVVFVIDHLGTGFAPPILGYRPEHPFAYLDTVLALAHLPNLRLKLTGGPSVSLESYPFRDIWQPVTRLIGSFGAERTFWGTDYTRTAPLCSYWESRRYLSEIPGLSSEQLDLIYGDALAALLDWPTKLA